MITLRGKHEMMSQFGTGFSLSASNGERAGMICRKSAGFSGPIMVEGLDAGPLPRT